MDCLPEVRLPFSRRVGEIMWRALGRPMLDRWIEGADWIYCPKELYVPVSKARYAVTVHDLYWIEPAYRQRLGKSSYRWSGLLRRALREADLVLTVSNFTKYRMTELTDVDESKIRVVGNGVDEEFFRPREDKSDAEPVLADEPYILSVGGVTRKKGGDRLLNVARTLERVAPGVKLVVTGPVEREFHRRAAAAVNVRIVKRGFPNSEMKRLISGARASLTLSEYEGFGIPALEAMAVGTPVVAADRAALPEVIGDAGLIVDPEDSRCAADAVRSLIDDSPDRESLVKKGRERAEGYKWPHCVDRLYYAMREFSVGSSSSW